LFAVNSCYNKSMAITRTHIQPAYKKENGLWVLDLGTIELPDDFEVREKYITYFPPQQFGGNHKHPRKEAFIGLGENLRFIWLDDQGQKHEEEMNPQGELYLFIIPSQIPHAVINKSRKIPAILYELLIKSKKV